MTRIDPKSQLLMPPTTGIVGQKVSFKLFSELGALRSIGTAFVVLIFLLPFISADVYIIQIATQGLIYILLASGLNVVVGYAGLLDLGYVAFYAVGAYTSGILATQFGWPMWSTIPVVILVCIVAGIVIGGPTLRLRSDYLAIVTLGFGEIIRITAQNSTFTGGPSGINGIPSWSFGDWSFSDGLQLGGIYFPESILFYYLVAVFAVLLGIVGLPRLAKGKLGRAWMAVRDDEDAAEAMGINTYTLKITAYIIGAVWAGFAGLLNASLVHTIAPSSFQFLQSALVLMAVVIGGMASTPGVIVGALFISLVPELLRFVQNIIDSMTLPDWALATGSAFTNRYLVFGVLLLLMMLFRPEGMWPAKSILPWSKEKKKVAPAETVEATK